jgi:hypothetical protein
MHGHGGTANALAIGVVLEQHKISAITLCSPSGRGTWNMLRHLTIALGAIALGGVLAGCSSVGSGSYPFTAHANLDMYEKASKPRARQQARKPSSANESASELTGTVGAATDQPKMYSPEWWARERAREQREQERLSRAMRICRGC